MIVSIEQHVDFIADLFLKMQKEGDQSVAASQAAQDEWVDHVNELSKSDLVKSHSSCNSWYLGANIPGKPRVFMPYVGGVGRYRQECEEIVAAGYKGLSHGIKMQKEGDQSAAASQAAQDEWVDHVNELSTSDGFVLAC
eukprot:COSAG06_NODE_5280_length_3590_cov_2.803208_4_plen_139_part_00